MRRTKLPASAPLPAGSMPPSTWYEVPRCFACDDPIKSHRFSTSLLLGHTQYSHSSIPGKLGEYIGDGFVVVVTSQDALCRNCMNLLNTMDRLEEELRDHRNRLVGNLRRKYGLDPGGTQAVAKPNKKHAQAVEEDDIIEIQSDEEWTPYNKKRKVTSSRMKPLICNTCKMEFTDLNRFMLHLKRHKDEEDARAAAKEIKVAESDIPKSFKCGCCTLSFDKKEALAAHMRLHTGDKQLSRPAGVASTGEPTAPLKSNNASNTNNGNKLYPKPTSQTVVEMKLIMDAGKKASLTVATKESSPLEKPVTVTKVTEKDTGGKVCLLALWNSGSCSEPNDYQNPTDPHTSSAISAQQIPPVTQGEMFIPRIIVQQSQDGVPEVAVSQPQLKMSDLVSQSHFQITTSVGQQSNSSDVASVSLANTHIVTIPHSVPAPAQLPANISQPVSQIVISVPNQSNINYTTSSQQTSSILRERQSVPLNPAISKEVALKTSDDFLPSSSIISHIDQKSVTPLSGNLNEQSAGGFQTQPSNKHSDEKPNSLITNHSNSGSECSKGNKSMPLLDHDVLQPVTTERTIVEQDEMGNIAIVNVGGVEGSETAYAPKDDETDWFLASEQSNAALEPPDLLWGNQDNAKSGMAAIDQVDGMRSSSSVPFEVREQSDSVDEDEKSEYFTSRYVVDAEKLRQEAEALADAIFAAIKS